MDYQAYMPCIRYTNISFCAPIFIALRARFTNVDQISVQLNQVQR